MRDGAAVIKCKNYPLGAEHRAAAVVNFYGADIGLISAGAPLCDRCAEGFRKWRPFDWDYLLPLLQPSTATDYEVTCVEVMCSGIARVGVPR